MTGEKNEERKKSNAVILFSYDSMSQHDVAKNQTKLYYFTCFLLFLCVFIIHFFFLLARFPKCRVVSTVTAVKYYTTIWREKKSEIETKAELGERKKNIDGGTLSKLCKHSGCLQSLRFLCTQQLQTWYTNVVFWIIETRKAHKAQEHLHGTMTQVKKREKKKKTTRENLYRRPYFSFQSVQMTFQEEYRKEVQFFLSHSKTWWRNNE